MKKPRRYFIARNATCTQAPLVTLARYIAFLEWHSNWDEVTFTEWWPVHWQETDFVGECPPCPDEAAFWDGGMAYSAGVEPQKTK